MGSIFNRTTSVINVGHGILRTKAEHPRTNQHASPICLTRPILLPDSREGTPLQRLYDGQMCECRGQRAGP